MLQQQTLLPLLTQLKILSRNENHRQNVGEKVIASLICHMSDQESGTKVQAEGANVILNLCYEKENVINVLNCGGASTLVFQQYSWNLLIIIFFWTYTKCHPKKNGSSIMLCNYVDWK